jgi:hypothetical protein
MPMDGKKGLIYGLLLILCLLGFTACRKSPEAKAAFVTGRISSYLDLDDSQKTKLDAVAQEILDVRSETQAQRGKILSELASQIRSEHLEPERLRALAREHRQEIGAKMIPRVLGRLIDFHHNLRPEQKEKIAKVIEGGGQR